MYVLVLFLFLDDNEFRLIRFQTFAQEFFRFLIIFSSLHYLQCLDIGNDASTLFH